MTPPAGPRKRARQRPAAESWHATVSLGGARGHLHADYSIANQSRPLAAPTNRDMTTPRDDECRRQPALDAGEHRRRLAHLVREEERQEEAERNAHERGHGVGRQNFRTGRGRSRREEARPEPITCRAVKTILTPWLRYAALICSSREGSGPNGRTPAEHRSPSGVRPNKGDVARKHPDEANRQRDPPPQDIGGKDPPVTIGSSSGMELRGRR